MALQKKIIEKSSDKSSGGSPFFLPAANAPQIQKQEADLPGPEPEAPRYGFNTPDSFGITNNKDQSITFDVRIDYLPSHTQLHVYAATHQGGDYVQGMPLSVIGQPGKGGDFTATLSPVPSHFYVVLKAISSKTGISVPNVTGTCVQSLD